MVTIPELVTERLILRGMGKEDFEPFAALWQEPEVVRFIGAKPRPISESWGVFLRIAGSWVINGFGQWAITRRSDGAFVGQCGFFMAMRGLGQDFDTVPESGWVLTTGAQGQGLGREAVAAAHRWFDAQPFAGRTVAMIEIGHEGSFAVARRLGYRPMREVEDLGDRVMLLERIGADRVIG